MIFGFIIVHRTMPFQLLRSVEGHPSPFASALSPSGGATGGASYPQLPPSAFSMLGPHPLFPGGAMLPFGGLGALGDNLMSAGAFGHGLDGGTCKLLRFSFKIWGIKIYI